MSGECDKCSNHTLQCSCKEARPKNRPLTEIDWSQVAEWLKEGSNGVQAAARIGIHPDTLYRRCEAEQGMTFTAYCQEKKAMGDSMLHAAQFKKALRGDASMLKHLGEWRLGQKEVKNVEESATADRNFILLLGQIAKENPSLFESIRSFMETQQSLLHQGPTRSENQVQHELGSEGAI